MADRRRNNGPLGSTKAPLYDYAIDTSISKPPRPKRTRKADQLRRIFIQTGLTPPASGSAYLELESHPIIATEIKTPRLPTLKLSCSVHGPRPLPRSHPFSPHLTLTVHVKYAPYASRLRRGYIRDPSERDLSAQLETALRGVVIGDRYPKTGVDVCVTVLEAEEDGWLGDSDTEGSLSGWGMSTVLAGAITVAGTALVDAGIDCVDLVAGGTAAIVDEDEIVLDPSPVEHEKVKTACVVAYLQTRDEMSLVWTRGAVSGDECVKLVDAAVKSAMGVRGVVEKAVKDGALRKLKEVS